MTNKFFATASILVATFLAGCQTPAATSSAWTGLHLDQAQFLAEENGFTCLAPTGVDFDKNGAAIRSTTCIKTQECSTVQRRFALDAHTMVVQATRESAMPIKPCTVEEKPAKKE